ncbi:hypothetical protein BpHYR1_006687 [Brachionus plicatilis]|uniref:Uncharacterized protein n=1 Tax=Brachionus plicatilis TaxID=10195 RepID=A0A3M7S2M3_BRAPC|nr:hypothetical protein BpHYR1_006687 [Brachionus plicatilis]
MRNNIKFTRIQDIQRKFSLSSESKPIASSSLLSFLSLLSISIIFEKICAFLEFGDSSKNYSVLDTVKTNRSIKRTVFCDHLTGLPGGLFFGPPK